MPWSNCTIWSSRMLGPDYSRYWPAINLLELQGVIIISVALWLPFILHCPVSVSSVKSCVCHDVTVSCMLKWSIIFVKPWPLSSQILILSYIKAVVRDAWLGLPFILHCPVSFCLFSQALCLSWRHCILYVKMICYICQTMATVLPDSDSFLKQSKEMLGWVLQEQHSLFVLPAIYSICKKSCSPLWALALCSYINCLNVLLVSLW